MNNQIETGKYTHRDVDSFFTKMLSVASKREYRVKSLGYVGKDPIYFIYPEASNKLLRILIAGGFHGEEPAGCWGILQFLEEAKQELFEKCCVSFLPLVNPTGIRQGRRQNDWGENPNSGYCHTKSGKLEASREGKILMDNLKLLKDYARDGFLSLHEDIDCTEFYLYTFEKHESPGGFSKCLREAEASFFKPMPDGILEGGVIKDGIIFNHCDGSFEDRLFHEGVPRTACTETPGKLEFSLRVEANSKIAEAFVCYNMEKEKHEYDHK